jgi:hypothetical protein
MHMDAARWNCTAAVDVAMAAAEYRKAGRMSCRPFEGANDGCYPSPSPAADSSGDHDQDQGRGHYAPPVGSGPAWRVAGLASPFGSRAWLEGQDRPFVAGWAGQGNLPAASRDFRGWAIGDSLWISENAIGPGVSSTEADETEPTARRSRGGEINSPISHDTASPVKRGVRPWRQHYAYQGGAA